MSRLPSTATIASRSVLMRTGMIVMEQDTRPAPPEGRLVTGIERLQGQWSGASGDERQQAVWNKAAASGMYLMMWASLIAALAFMAIDDRKYSTIVFILLLIGFGGPGYAAWVARRQGFTPASRVPSWPSLALSGLMFGVLMFVVDRWMDPGHDWRIRVIGCVVAVAIFVVGLRLLLQRRHDRSVRPTNGTPSGQ
jgi:hypothetical protein